MNILTLNCQNVNANNFLLCLICDNVTLLIIMIKCHHEKRGKIPNVTKTTK